MSTLDKEDGAPATEAPSLKAIGPPTPPTEEHHTPDARGNEENDGRYGLIRRWQIGIRESDYSTGYKAVAWALSTRMTDPHGTATWNPAQETIAKDAGVGKRTVQRATDRLDDDGWLRRAGGRGRGSNYHYRLRIPPEGEALIETVLGGKRRHQRPERVTRRDWKKVTPGPPSFALAKRSVFDANACAFCGKTASPSRFTQNYYGDRLCASHNSSDPAYLAWSTARVDALQ